VSSRPSLSDQRAISAHAWATARGVLPSLLGQESLPEAALLENLAGEKHNPASAGHDATGLHYSWTSSYVKTQRLHVREAVEPD
jgi:hypothetical protein